MNKLADFLLKGHLTKQPLHAPLDCGIIKLRRDGLRAGVWRRRNVG
jgi:hypothetical protein